MKKIVLTGGGSAGHCTPHLALLPFLKEKFDEIYYIGSKTGIEKEIIENEKIPYYGISCAKFIRSFSLKNLSIPFKVASGITEAGKLLDKLKPDVVFSKGGYVALPVVIAAHKRKIPVIAHESDYTVGLANRISSKYCEKVLTTFPDTAKGLKNGEFVGAPIRNTLIKFNKSDAYKRFNLTGDKPIITVIGGSLGATAINQAVRTALPKLLQKFDVVHICGKGNVDSSIHKKGYFQAEYLHDIQNALGVASVCVTRAGSNALFELLSLKKPCVVIPLPKGNSRGDQVLNASYFQKEGFIYVLPQDELSASSLCFYIDSAYSNRTNIKRILEDKPFTDKSQEIVKILSKFAK